MTSHITSLPFLNRTLRPLVEFIYPPMCFVCESLLAGSDSRVCPACWSTIEPVTVHDLPYQETRRRLSGGASPHEVNAHPPGGEDVDLISLYYFEKEGTLQSIIHQLKYGGMWSLGVELGRKLGEELRGRMSVSSIDAMIPVPLHATKMRERGYNQSEYIARGIHQVTDIPVSSSLLRRHKYTSSQTQLTVAERMENVGDAFSLNKRGPADLEGKTFILVDDVITTGATIKACARVLMEGGGCSVLAVSVAIAEHTA